MRSAFTIMALIGLGIGIAPVTQAAFMIFGDTNQLNKGIEYNSSTYCNLTDMSSSQIDGKDYAKLTLGDVMYFKGGGK